MSIRQPAAPYAPVVRIRWTPLLILAVAAFATVTAELLPASLLLQLSDGLHVSASSAGLLIAVWALTIAATSVPLVRWTRRVPRGRLLSLVLRIFALATVGTAIAPSYQLVLLGRVVCACAHGLFWSLLIPTAASLAPPAVVGRAVSVVLAGPALAGIIGVPLGAAIGAAVGWRVVFVLVAAVLGLASLSVRLLALPDPAVTTQITQSVGRWSAVGALVAVAAAAAAVLTGHFVLYTYISPLLEEFGGYGGTSLPALLLVFGLGGVAGISASGPLSDRYPRQALTWVSIAFAVTALSLRLVVVDEIAAFIVLAIWGALIGLLPPVFQIRLLRTAAPGTEAIAGAVAITVVNLGITAGAVLGGLSVRIFDVGTLPFVAAAIIGTSAVAQLVSDARHSARTGRRGDRCTG